MERIVIVGYKPKPGKEQALDELVTTHVEILRGQGLATQRTPIVMKSENGVVVEVFGWVSQKAIEDAHRHPVVQEMWDQFNEVCEYVPVSELSEAKALFSEFAAFEV